MIHIYKKLDTHGATLVSIVHTCADVDQLKRHIGTVYAIDNTEQFEALYIDAHYYYTGGGPDEVPTP